MEQFELGGTLKLIWLHPAALPQDRVAASSVGVTNLVTPKAEHELSFGVPLFLSFTMDFYQRTQLLGAPRQAVNSFFFFPPPLITQNRKTKIRMEQFVSNINNMKVYQLFTF